MSCLCMTRSTAQELDGWFLNCTGSTKVDGIKCNKRARVGDYSLAIDTYLHHLALPLTRNYIPRPPVPLQSLIPLHTPFDLRSTAHSAPEPSRLRLIAQHGRGPTPER
jgi:hypothetical protein